MGERARRARPVTPLRWLTVALASLQVISPGLFALLSPTALDSGSANEAVITPAGYAFAIWGLICPLSLATAVALCRDDPPVQAPRRLHLDLCVVFAGFNLWLLLAALDWLWATVAVFATMAIALVDVLVVLARPDVTAGQRWLQLCFALPSAPMRAGRAPQCSSTSPRRSCATGSVRRAAPA